MTFSSNIIFLLKTNKVVIGSIIILVALSVLIANILAHKNAKDRIIPYPTPSSITPVLLPSLSPLPTKTPKPTIKPTVKPTIQPSQNNSQTLNVYITYYGWNDNDPPGTAIAYPKIHSGAGGVGSYGDPVTFASDPKVFPAGTKIYVPYIKKYAIMEDLCASCRGNHIDIWAGGNGANENKLIACEESFTRDSQTIELNPPSTHLVDTSPLFNSETATCGQ